MEVKNSEVEGKYPLFSFTSLCSLVFFSLFSLFPLPCLTTLLASPFYRCPSSLTFVDHDEESLVHGRHERRTLLHNNHGATISQTKDSKKSLPFLRPQQTTRTTTRQFKYKYQHDHPAETDPNRPLNLLPGGRCPHPSSLAYTRESPPRRNARIGVRGGTRRTKRQRAIRGQRQSILDGAIVLRRSLASGHVRRFRDSSSLQQQEDWRHVLTTIGRGHSVVWGDASSSEEAFSSEDGAAGEERRP